MGFNVSNKTIAERLKNTLSQAQRDQADSFAKLSSGTVFTPEDPRPAERALSEKMEFKLRALNASKRNISDATSFLQTAESSMSEITNMINRMKEIHISAANTTVGDQERRYLFIEYQALYDEIDRISQTAEFNGIPLLNGESEKAPEELIFRIGDAAIIEDPDDRDELTTIRMPNFEDINTTPEALGIYSARDLLDDYDPEEGIPLDEIEEMLEPDDDEYFATVYDEALSRLSTQRAEFGGVQTRLHRALDFVEVFHENIHAAKARIEDVDYAAETAKLMQSQIQSMATTALLSQTHTQMESVLQLLR
ncbi:MAG: flagellin [Zetaproteobacteria bacterium]|nr:flagellin [Zetaproteobacteria bacterium]